MKGVSMIKNTHRCLLLTLILSVGCCFSAQARQITDMVGRQVTIPDVIRTVYGTSPPATYMVYAFDPGMVAGLNFPFNQSEKEYLDPRLQSLPVIGGWFGQGRVSNLETLLQVRPDIILVWAWQMSAVNEKIEQALKPLEIPVVYMIMDTLDDYPAAFRFIGELFGMQARARALCSYAEATLEETARVRATIPEEERVSVYYAEGADGLSTECHTSVHAQLIPLSGGKNVHRCSSSNVRGMQKISMEQVLQYDPQVIVAHEPLFFSHLEKETAWRNIRAVREGRVYRIPRTPLNWFDRPPSFMRLLGLKWMTHQLYPAAYPLDLVAETRHFYKLFLNVTLDEELTRKLFQP
jgi:iron complex transport system substrate-binding protein